MIYRDNTLLTNNAHQALGWFNRMKGLLGRNALAKNEALILEPCSSIHTFFMKFPIDVIFLNQNNTIVSIYENLKPNRITRIWFGARRAVELPAGTLQRWNLAKGQQLKLSV